MLLRRTAAPAETYYGDRTSDAFFAWMGHEHKILAAEQAAAKAAEGNSPTPAADGSDDTAVPIRMHARGSKGVEGCMMEGSLRVKRVPVRTRRLLDNFTAAVARRARYVCPERAICEALILTLIRIPFGTVGESTHTVHPRQYGLQEFAN
jgi:hypothetical protein